VGLCDISQQASFCREKFSAPRPNPKLEFHHLSFVRYCLFNIVNILSIPGGRPLHPQPEDAPCHGDKGPILQGYSQERMFKNFSGCS
jgi:hypothetical protein